MVVQFPNRSPQEMAGLKYVFALFFIAMTVSETVAEDIGRQKRALGLSSIVEGLTNAAGNITQSAENTIGSIATGAVNSTVNTVNNLTNNSTSGILNPIKDTVDNLIDIKVALTDAVIQEVLNVVNKTINETANLIGILPNLTYTIVPNLNNLTVDFLSEVFGNLTANVTRFISFKNLTDISVANGSNLQSVVEGLQNTIGPLLVIVGPATNETISQLSDAIQEVLGSLTAATELIGFVNNLPNFALDIVNQVLLQVKAILGPVQKI